MEDTTSFHPIACEICRNKKSKCDRELPTCSQCIFAGLTCRYPPINKRGIPSGYLNFVEQRLLETELVVIELLSAFYSSPVPIKIQRLPEAKLQFLAESSRKQSKSAKIQEWKEMPLETDGQRHQWWLNRCEMMSQTTLARAEDVNQNSPTRHGSWAGASPGQLQFDDAQTSGSLQPLTGNIPQTQHPTQTSIVPWPSGLDAVMGGQLEPPSQLADNNTTGTPEQNFNNDIVDLPSDKPSVEKPVSACPPSLTEARWRKYF